MDSNSLYKLPKDILVKMLCDISEELKTQYVKEKRDLFEKIMNDTGNDYCNNQECFEYGNTKVLSVCYKCDLVFCEDHIDYCRKCGADFCLACYNKINVVENTVKNVENCSACGSKICQFCKHALNPEGDCMRYECMYKNHE